MTDQNKHIEKLKKLLALAASGNPHEAPLWHCAEPVN